MAHKAVAITLISLHSSAAFTRDTNSFHRSAFAVFSLPSRSEGWTAQSSWGSSTWSSDDEYSFGTLEPGCVDPPSDFVSEAASVPGDYGFDPLNLQELDLHAFSATDGAMQVLRTQNFVSRPAPLVLKDYRDAELRHGRLAMLAAVAWPMQELIGPALARALNRRAGLSALSDALAETEGRSPSLLNGGLAHGWLPLTLLGVAACVGAAEVRALRIRAARGDDFVPGDLGFDPLRIIRGASPEKAFRIRQLEVDHGRGAMLAVATFVAEEAAANRPVTEITPQLFVPMFLLSSVHAFIDEVFSAVSAIVRTNIFQPHLY